jgi:hypothetical protein
MKSHSLNRQLSEKIVKFKTVNKITSIISFEPILSEFTLDNYLRMVCLGFILSMFFSCSNNDRDNDGVLDKNDLCPDIFAITKDGCLPKEIDNVHFYIEISASMGGYFNKDAEFKTIVSDLTTKIEKNIKPLDIWFISELESKYTKSTAQFSSDLATTKIADQKSSELHKIISNITTKNDSNDVTLLVSDCILSFSDKDIKANPEINKHEAPNALKNNIYSTFADLKKKGFATSIYAFNSKFYGTYYNYQNGKTMLKGLKRPFYLWVIADKEILGKFNTKLNDIPTFKPEKSLHFGLNEEPITYYDLIPQIERKGNWMKCSQGLKDIEINNTEQLQFCIAFNLENLPEYAKDIAYLQANLKIANSGCEVSFEVKDKSKVDKSKLKSQPQIESLERATHTIIFKVKEMTLTEAKINITLPLQYDTWYRDWSCEDDKDLSKVEGKTFALEHLIVGVKEAYETKNKNYINFSITLTK